MQLFGRPSHDEKQVYLTWDVVWMWYFMVQSLYVLVCYWATSIGLHCWWKSLLLIILQVWQTSRQHDQDRGEHCEDDINQVAA